MSQGRGQPDSCLSCPGGRSAGNPVPSDTVIGYGLGGVPITVADVVASRDPLDRYIALAKPMEG